MHIDLFFLYNGTGDVMKKVKVNQELCIGCGACQAIAESVFQLNDEGFAETKKESNTVDTMEEELKNDVMDALEGCPTSAIFMEEQEEKEAA